MGYIQASLYLAFVEANNLMTLSPIGSEAKNENLTSDLPEPLTTKSAANYQTIEPKRIEVYCDEMEIKKIWQVLTEPITKSKGIEQPVFNKDELEKYLGAMFCSGAFPEAFKHSIGLPAKTTSRGDMRNVLIALMYCCYNLNRNFYRGSNQITYAAMLKRYFSVFSTSEIESTKSIMATYAPKGIEVLKNNGNKNPHIEEILSILKIHKLLHCGFKRFLAIPLHP